MIHPRLGRRCIDQAERDPRGRGDGPDADRFCAEDPGPPAPQLCPMVLCETCGGRIHQNRASSAGGDGPALQTGIATSWSRYVGPSSEPGHTRLESSPLFYVHQGACDRTHREYLERFYRPDDGWVSTWDDIREVIKQLVHTTTHPLESDPALASGEVVYLPPARVVDLRPPDFAITPKWFVGNPDLPT